MQSDLDDSTVFCDPAKFLPPSCPELNEKIPAYHFLEYIDRGGMGAVYKARQKSLNRIVAVKLLPPANVNRRGLVDQFRREAEALARLNHPNIVAVYDSGETDDGFVYYAMELVQGQGDLARLMRAGNLNDSQRLKIVTQVCEALQYAHDRKVVHRDIKPSNILIDELGNAKVADFGLAKILLNENRPSGTLSGVMGTPEYVAPEALEGGSAVDHRADIYSLGVMLYEMLTGHVPKGVWEPPSKSGADKRLDHVVSRALQTDPGQRYQRASDMTAVLQPLLRPSSRLDRGAPSLAPRRSRLTRVAAFAVPTVLSSIALVLWFNPALRGRLALFPPTTFEGGALSIVEVPTARELQMQLAHWVIHHHGFVNLHTEFQHDNLMGDQHDITSETQLPEGEFSIWRVSMSENPDFNDEDMFGLIRVCEQAGTVENLNLFSTRITPLGLGQIMRLDDSLMNLNIRNTASFSADSVPFITACHKLRNLLISLPDGPTEEGRSLITQIEIKLPECTVSYE